VDALSAGRGQAREKCSAESHSEHLELRHKTADPKSGNSKLDFPKTSRAVPTGMVWHSYVHILLAPLKALFFIR